MNIGTLLLCLAYLAGGAVYQAPSPIPSRRPDITQSSHPRNRNDSIHVPSSSVSPGPILAECSVPAYRLLFKQPDAIAKEMHYYTRAILSSYLPQHLDPIYKDDQILNIAQILNTKASAIQHELIHAWQEVVNEQQPQDAVWWSTSGWMVVHHYLRFIIDTAQAQAVASPWSSDSSDANGWKKIDANIFTPSLRTNEWLVARTYYQDFCLQHNISLDALKLLFTYENTWAKVESFWQDQEQRIFTTQPGVRCPEMHAMHIKMFERHGQEKAEQLAHEADKLFFRYIRAHWAGV